MAPRRSERNKGEKRKHEEVKEAAAEAEEQIAEDSEILRPLACQSDSRRFARRQVEGNY